MTQKLWLINDDVTQQLDIESFIIEDESNEYSINETYSIIEVY